MMGARPSVALLPPIIVGMRLLALSLFLNLLTALAVYLPVSWLVSSHREKEEGPIQDCRPVTSNCF